MKKLLPKGLRIKKATANVERRMEKVKRSKTK